MKYVWLCLLGLCSLSAPAWGAGSDWGVVPVGQDATYSFSASNITSNFSDLYSFAIGSSTEASYSVTVAFDVCRNGCGSPELSYGIYYDNGTLVSSSGSAQLFSGNYVFKISGTGMGSGNSLDYSGSMSIVSAVPEPSEWALMGVGAVFLAWAVHRRRASHAWTGARA